MQDFRLPCTASESCGWSSARTAETSFFLGEYALLVWSWLLLMSIYTPFQSQKKVSFSTQQGANSALKSNFWNFGEAEISDAHEAHLTGLQVGSCNSGNHTALSCLGLDPTLGCLSCRNSEWKRGSQVHWINRDLDVGDVTNGSQSSLGIFFAFLYNDASLRTQPAFEGCGFQISFGSFN